MNVQGWVTTGGTVLVVILIEAVISAFPHTYVVDPIDVLRGVNACEAYHGSTNVTITFKHKEPPVVVAQCKDGMTITVNPVASK